jgi:hypothetical protein
MSDYTGAPASSTASASPAAKRSGEAGRAAEERPGQLAGVTAAGPPPMLPGMTDTEIVMADLWATSITTGKHPVEEVRPQPTAADILSAQSSARPITEPASGPRAQSPTANAGHRIRGHLHEPGRRNRDDQRRDLGRLLYPE